MGAIFSIPKSINNKVDGYIFYPPKTPEHLFYTLKHHRTFFFRPVTKNNIAITALMVYPKTDFNKYIVFSHGNASDIYELYRYFETLANILNVCIVAYDYVGYGLARNHAPSEQGCYDSLECVMEYLMNVRGINKKNIFLVGQSLGTGITIDYMAKHQWTTPAMLISPYKSICRVIIDTSMVTPIDKFRTLQKIKVLNCPIKILHGKKDDLIDISHGIELYKLLKNKTLAPVWFDNIGHDDILRVITKDHYEDVLNN